MKALPILVMTFLVTMGAPLVEAVPKAEEDRQAPAANDPLIGTEWDFLGVKRQRINGFKFLKDGRVRCESTGFKHDEVCPHVINDEFKIMTRETSKGGFLSRLFGKK
jgi:hypothetical protein